MSKEFTIEDLGDTDDVRMLLTLAGSNEKGERFVLYMARLELNGREMGGVIRLEKEDGRGYEVGRVGFTTSSFARPIVRLTTFNSCPQLTGRVLQLAADDKLCWQLRQEMEREAYTLGTIPALVAAIVG